MKSRLWDMIFGTVKWEVRTLYRPSLYDKHDETMNRFAEMFNRLEIYRNIIMRPNPVETFDNDGVFIDIETNRSIGYDWEYRDRYFAYCKLAFESLGQYERKIKKPSIQLSLQCDSTVTGVAVGWHEDWLNEEREKRSLKTDYSKKEKGTLRYTTNFRIYSFEELDSFKHMVATAMRLQLYSSKIFEMMENGKLTAPVNQKESIRDVSKLSKQAEISSPKSLLEFFRNKGLKVVDKRDKGGCLWVIGSENEIGDYIKEACKLFRISGNYGSGRATGYMPGWFTKSQK